MRRGNVRQYIAAGIWDRNVALLVLIMVGAVAIRIAAILTFWRPGAIGGEGAEYARIAENLRNGFGYVGIATPGPELLFPPLFPILIALSSILTGDYELAGRVVAIVFGSALPLPAYAIASRLFNRSVGVVAALIAAFHPLLIGLSITVLSEGPYATLLLSAVYVTLRAVEDWSSTKAWALVGAAFGVAYLVRQEAIAPFFIAVVFAVVATPGARVLKCRRVIAAVIVFFLAASAQITFLYKTTGTLRLEGKSAISFAWFSRIFAGQDAREAGYAINEKLEGTGVWMSPNVTVVRQTRIGLKELIQFVAKAARIQLPNLFRHLSAPWLGAPLLPAVALLGAFRRPWRRSTALGQLFMLFVPATAIVATFSGPLPNPRYHFVLIPFISIWAANGFLAMMHSTKTSLNAIVPREFPFLASAVAALVITSLSLVSYAYTFVNVRSTELGEEAADQRGIKDVGRWIRGQQNSIVKIMDVGTPPAFHAGANYVHFPYTDAATAIRFLDSAKVDYLILRRGMKFTEYYEDWLSHGIPDPRAKLVYVSSGPNPGEFVVFRWKNESASIQPRLSAYGR